MKRVFVILLLLAGCDSEPEAAAPNNPAPAAASETEEAMPAGAEVAAIQQRIQQALVPMLQDSATARYSNLRNGSAGAACGNVDDKLPDGSRSGFRPFVITPEGVAVVSPAARVAFDDAGDIVSDFYIRWCASPEELARLGPELAARAASPVEVPPLPPEIAALPPPEPTAEIPPAPAAAPAAGSDSRWGQRPKSGNSPVAKPTGEDSFADAVLRKREDTK